MPAPRGAKWETDIEYKILVLGQRMGKVFRGSGMQPNGQGGLDSDNYVPGVSGFRFDAAGNAEFNDLTLRGEIIGNDALAQPVIPGVVNATDVGITVTNSWGDVTAEDVTVPTGCTQLLAHVTSMVFAVNPNTTGGSNGTGGDILECRSCVGDTNGLVAGVSISGSNGQTSVTSSLAVLLTGLTPGSTVTVKTQALSGFQDFGPNAYNQANASATLLWLR